MIKLTDVMRDMLRTALAENVPCLIGTASKSGRPQISPKGSVAVYDDETLCYWERSFRTGYGHLGENPQVVIYYRNVARADALPFRSGAVRFYGQARIVESGPERERAWELTVQAEKDRDPEKKGVAVLVRVDKVDDLTGKVLMERD